MPAAIKIRPAAPLEAAVVAGILNEVAAWLRESGQPMWKADELDPGRIAADVKAGLFYIAEVSGDAAGTMKFELEDPDFWPDMSRDDACYVHRLAVRRPYAGLGLSAALLGFAAQRTEELGRAFLRLDCESSRARLRALYESFGFAYHSDRQVGPYHVSRYEYRVAGRDAGAARRPG
jgi:GNAT superfamily N-acetyltransferase